MYNPMHNPMKESKVEKSHGGRAGTPCRRWSLKRATRWPRCVTSRWISTWWTRCEVVAEKILALPEALH